MPKCQLEIKASVQKEKELDALDDLVFARVDRKIVTLTENPRPAGCKKLKGCKNTWRIRVGDWRVVYIVDDSAASITITRVAHRREIYDRD